MHSATVRVQDAHCTCDLLLYDLYGNDSDWHFIRYLVTAVSFMQCCRYFLAILHLFAIKKRRMALAFTQLGCMCLPFFSVSLSALSTQLKVEFEL